MSKATVQAGQTLLDIAVQYLGSGQKVFELAKLNNLSITAALTNGQELKLGTIKDARTVKFLKDGGWYPAANLEQGDFLDNCGVDFWAIGYDFIVGESETGEGVGFWVIPEFEVS